MEGRRGVEVRVAGLGRVNAQEAAAKRLFYQNTLRRELETLFLKPIM